MPTLTGNNRRREQRLQELLLLRLSQQFERRLSREIARAMREGAIALERDAVSPSDSIRERHDRNLTRLLNNLWSAAIGDMAEHMQGSQRSWAGKLERKQDDGFDADAFLRTWIANEGVTKVRRITSTTQENIRRMIEQGARDGMGQREVGKMIRERAPTIGAARSQVIARTEVHSASQATAQAVAEDAGLDMRKVWVSSRGERTRTIEDGAQFDHLAADGQTVRMDQPFVIEGLSGSEEIMYPGDPNGSAGNIINCFDGNVPVAFDSCKKSIASRYSGEIITVETAAGYKVTGTPNHPVMTDSGPIPLGQVNHFTNLVCCPLNRNISNGFDVENVPTTFKELHDTLSIVGMRVGVAGVPVNLYGRAPDCEADIVRPEGVLRNGIKPPNLKSRLNLCLKMTSFSRHVHLDNAVSIKVKRVSEHNVYTIETEEGFYNAGGIVAQNCRCAVVYEVV